MRKLLIATIFGLAALASAPARADLLIYVNGTQEADDTTNTSASWSGTASGFQIQELFADGVNSFPGTSDLLDVSNLDITTQGKIQVGATLSLVVTETNLTGAQILEFMGQFSAPSIENLSVTRTFWIDPNNAGGEVTSLGQTSTSGTTNFNVYQDLRLHAEYSLTEDIEMTYLGGGTGKFSGDDDMSLPEPTSLSLFGVGLLALGAMAKRRRTTSKTN